MRTSLLALSLVVLLGGCTQDEAQESPAAATGCGALDGQQEEQLGTPDVQEVPDQQANVVLKLSSSSKDEQDITVRADDQVLLTVRVPAAPADCYLGGAVFVHHFRLPAKQVRLEATAGEQRSTATLTPSAERQWVTVLPQDGFPLDVKVWSDEPLFG